MALMDDLVLDGTNADEIEGDIKSGGTIPRGDYHAVLTEAEEAEAGQSGKKISKLTFEVTDPKFAGKNVDADLFHEGNSESATKVCKNQLIHFGVKLGLIEKVRGSTGINTFRYAQGKADFVDVIGAPCIISVDIATFKRKDGTEGQKNVVKMFGIAGPNEAAPSVQAKAMIEKKEAAIAGAKNPNAGDYSDM